MEQKSVQRFLSVDPLAEKYPSMSPYNYCANNPVKYVDPDGRDWVEGKDGNIYWNKNAGVNSRGRIIGLEKGEIYRGKTYMRHVDVDDKKFTREQYSSDKTITKTRELRPDSDGYLTNEEAKDWYRGGSGVSLYVDLRKIDISPLSTKDFDKDDNYILTYNFFGKPGAEVNTAKVYGQLSMRLRNPKTGEVGFSLNKKGFVDNYDFNQNKDDDFFRNSATYLVKTFIMYKGKSFEIYPLDKTNFNSVPVKN